MKRRIFVLLAAFVFLGFAVNCHAYELEALGGIDIHGFLSQGYMGSSKNNYLASDSSEGTFSFNELGINFSKDLSDKLRIGLQLFSMDLGEIGNNDIAVDWAYGDYRWKDWLGLRAGRLKNPMGLYNETRDLDMLRTNIILPQGIYEEPNRSFFTSIQGLGFYGELPLKSLGGLSYFLLVGTMEIENDTSIGSIRKFNSSGVFTVREDLDFDEAFSGSLEWQTPLPGLLLKTTGLYTTAKMFGQTVVPLGALPAGMNVTLDFEECKSWVYSLQYTWKDLVVNAEYRQNRYQATLYLDATGDVIQKMLMKSGGYYIGANYRFNDWFEAGAYYSKSYADSDDKDGKEAAAAGTVANAWQNYNDDIALSLRFDINENWVLKLENHFMKGTYGCLDLDNTSYEKNWNLFVAKCTFSF